MIQAQMTLTTEHIARMPPPDNGTLPHPSTIFRLTASTRLRRVTGFRKKWKSAELSCSREIDVSRRGLRKRVWWPCGPAMEKFDREIVGEIEGLLKNVDLGDADIYLRLYMIGRSPETSRPVIMVCCSDPRVRAQAEEAIRESRVPEEYPEFALGASALPLEQPGLVRALAGTTDGTQAARSQPQPSQGHKRAKEDDEDDEPQKRSTPDRHRITMGHPLPTTSRPVGRRISIGSRHATGGVVIRVGSRDYQLTVSHVTDDDDLLSAFRDSDRRNLLEECHFDDISEDDEDDDEADLHISYESNAGTMSGPQPPSHIPENAYVPRHLAVSEYDSRNGLNPGLDYMLLPLDVMITPEQPDILPNTIILRDGRMVEIGGVAVIPAEETEVVVATASGGVVHGVLLPTVLYLRNATLPSFQRLYPVHLESPVGLGDSGSAVVDKTTGELFGHLVRGADQSTTAYMVAATEIFEDIKRKTSSSIEFAKHVFMTRSSSHMAGGGHAIPTDLDLEETIENLDANAADLDSGLKAPPSSPCIEPWNSNSYSSGFHGGWDSDSMDGEVEIPGLAMLLNTEATTSATTSAQSTELWPTRNQDKAPQQHTGLRKHANTLHAWMPTQVEESDEELY
ncbi:hypothetical protein B0I37DRAFT_384074 [Chaetomium sp. MPI-CAGE-AT-0009]|nr:hypothetical protein B0I37DRAFT_384074 [Chaetomium sp. MPI-CAGE-AT-0009]